MQKVRAKFTCESVEQFTWGKVVKLRAIYGTEGENKDFAEATPNGQMEVTINPGLPAYEFFAPGNDFYLDFTPAE